jgi:Putative zinc-finger
MTNSDMTCEVFDAAFSDYLEGTLDGSTLASVEQHLRQCLRCAGLARDIENIQQEASALPDLVPAGDLWAGIEARIAAPVIPLTARPEKQRRFVPAWMGVAAAALVVSTAGVTYMLTARSLSSGNDRRVAATQPPLTQDRSGSGANPGVISGPAGSGIAGAQNVPEQSATSRLAQGSTGSRGSGVPATLASQNLPSGPSQSEAVYGKEIEMLQTIVRQRKTQLDSSTVAIIEKNLQIIDAAIEQSKAALSRDPASMLLSQQLTHALDKKVELLRTAAMLPAST